MFKFIFKFMFKKKSVPEELPEGTMMLEDYLAEFKKDPEEYARKNPSPINEMLKEKHLREIRVNEHIEAMKEISPEVYKRFKRRQIEREYRERFQTK